MESTTAAPTAYANEVKPGTTGIEAALDYATDRLERLDVQLEQLVARLHPALSPSQTPPSNPDVLGIPTTSPIGERVAGLGHHADRLADVIVGTLGRLEV